MGKLKKLMLFVLMALCMNNLNAKVITDLSNKQKSIIAIAALTAIGDQIKLKTALYKGLDAGLTINEVKEIMIQLCAYCGFPRSLNGINTFMAVLDERKAKGAKDTEGTSPLDVNARADKYAIGKKNLEELSGHPETGPKRGYAAFVPAIDTMLKEHLFADIFGRGVLTNQERELVTVSALVSLGGVEPQLSGHLSIAMHNGLTKQQLEEMIDILEIKIGKKAADAGRSVLKRVIARE